MTINRDLFVKDPTTATIPNDGVAKVLDPRDDHQWAVLRYELESFVCDGEYRVGLERILSTYLARADQDQQPAAWVSGFYGSGKSHFVRVLEYLWRDVTFPDGARARGLVRLPTEIIELLKELSTLGTRGGGLWSAAGTLSAGATGSVRIALLGIVFESAGLPRQEPQAQLAIWLKQQGLYDSVRVAVEAKGRSLDAELPNMYVSPILGEALASTAPTLGASTKEVLATVRQRFPRRDDVDEGEMVGLIADVLALQTSTPDRPGRDLPMSKMPCTLLIFDELQQFIGSDTSRTLQVQEVVEACSRHFGSRILFVGTGQSALQATTELSRLQGRFTVRVTLSDKDVEQVVREVVLRKKPDRVTELDAVLTRVRGEIDRHLGGSRIAPTGADANDLVPDYPLLPTRRRFWEAVLRSVDTAGTAGQLRTQLQVVHETTRAVALKPLGTVVPADVIYGQLVPGMLQSGVLLPEIRHLIEQLDDGTDDGRLRSRLAALVFLIGRLPTDGVAATGVRATATTLADLLVEDLTGGGGALQAKVPTLLQSLVDAGRLLQVGDEYRLQTQEGADWEQDYRARYAKIFADEPRIASERSNELRKAVQQLLKDVALRQGASKVPRKVTPHFGATPPSLSSGDVPLWVVDEWEASERQVREALQTAGPSSPVVALFLPRRDPEGIKGSIARHTAADETVSTRSVPTTDGGMEARGAMQSRVARERSNLDVLVKSVLGGARVYQGGGNEVLDTTPKAAALTALDASMIRLFPSFDQADHTAWPTVFTRAVQGNGDALAMVGHAGSAETHPVCQRILSTAPRKSSDG